MTNIDKPPEDRWHSRPWWQVVSAIAAVVAIPIGVLQLLETTQSDAGRQSEPPPPAVSSTGALKPSSATSSLSPLSTLPATSTAPAAGTVRWSGDVTLTEVEQTSTDLDTIPPQSTKDDQKGDITAGSLSSMLRDEGSVSDYDQSGFIAEWTKAEQPDFLQCRDRALAGGTDDVRGLRVGATLCVRTSEDRIVRLKITRVIEFDGFDTSAVVWENSS